MYGSLLTLMLITGANPVGPGCVDCGPGGVNCGQGAFSPYYCPHRQIDPTPGQEVYAQTSPHRPYPARTGFMFRYTFFYGIHYARPSNFRVLYDYPWYRRGDDLPRYTTEQLVDAEQDWIPIEEGMQPVEPTRTETPTPVAAKPRPQVRYRSALSVKRAAQ